LANSVEVLLSVNADRFLFDFNGLYAETVFKGPQLF
jgi:hypothetical protein